MKKENSQKHFGEILKLRLKEKGMTQVRLASETKLHASRVSAIVRRKTNITVDTQDEIIYALGFSRGEFYAGH